MEGAALSDNPQVGSCFKIISMSCVDEGIGSIQNTLGDYQD